MTVAISDLRWLVASSAELLSGADLFTLAFALSGRSQQVPMSVDEAVVLLQTNGLPGAVARPELVERIRQATSEDRSFVAYNERTFCLDRRVGLERRLGELVFRPHVQALLRTRPRGTRGRAPAPAKAPAAGRHAPARRGAEQRAPKAPAPAKRALAKPAPAPARESEPAPIPPPPPLVEAPVVFEGVGAGEVAALLETPQSDIAVVGRVLRAHALASAEQFEDLLALAALRGVTPHRYQIETVRRVLRYFRGRALLADEVGLGKTVEAIMVLREYELRGMVRRALILVPAPLVGQWVGELTEKGGVSPRTTDDAARAADPEGFWGAEGVVVASMALARSARHAATVQGVAWDLVVVDEAHHVKNRATSSYRLVNGLVSRFLLLLTATPIETDLEELYNLVTLVRPGQFASPAAFRAQFVDTKDPTSPRNRERLRALLGEVMVRNTRADSGLALPPRFVSTVAVEPLGEERALYEGVVALVRAWGREEGGRMLSSALLLGAGSSPAAVQASLERMQAVEGRAAGLREALAALSRRARAVQGSRKGQALVEIARGHAEQILVFTRFRATLGYAKAALQEAGMAAATFHGGLSAAEKRGALEAFRAGRARVLLSTDLGGEGQNLQHCHVLVNFDLPFNPMLIEQRIGRLHRMGQEEEVRVYNLCARGTAEERVLDLLDRRLHLFELVVGEMDMVLGHMEDDRDLEERIVALYAGSRSDEEVERGLDAIGREIEAARGRHEQVKRLDERLFGKDYEA